MAALSSFGPAPQPPARQFLTPEAGLAPQGAVVASGPERAPSSLPLAESGGFPSVPLEPHPAQVGTSGELADRIAVGAGPYPGVFDNRTGELFVSNAESDNVSVLQTANNTVVATVAVGVLPQRGCLDSTDGLLYVSNFGSANVSVISVASTRVVASLNLTSGYSPTTCAFDPATDKVFIPNTNLSASPLYSTDYPYLTVVDAASHTIKDNLQLEDDAGDTAATPTIDLANGLLYVAINDPPTDSGRVAVFNASTDSQVTGFTVGSQPAQPAYDPANGRLYVASYNTTYVSVIDGTDNTLLPAIHVGDGSSMPAVDVATGTVYVPASVTGNGGNLTVINGTTDNITRVVGVGDDPQTPIVDLGNGSLYVAEANDGVLTQLSLGTDTIVRNYSIGNSVSAPTLDGFDDLYVSYELLAFQVGGVAVIPSSALRAWLSADPARVAEDNPLALTAHIVGGSGPLSFAWEGLPPDCGSNDAAELNCTPAEHGAFVPEVTVYDSQGREANASLNLTVLAAYPVFVQETGLPNGTTWFANTTGLPVLRATAAAVTVDLPNGTFPYRLASGNSDFTPVPPTTVVRIDGSPAWMWANFSTVTFPVNFVASGLPSAIPWFVNISMQPSHAVIRPQTSVPLDNGTHSYTVVSADRRYGPSPGVGGVVVIGRSQTINVTFRYLEYPVGVDEAGLPAGAEWFFNVSGQPSAGSSAGDLSESLANGTYAYSVSTVDKNFAPTNPTGTMTVVGGRPPVNVTFAPVTFAVPFVESGLPRGTSWGIHLGATTVSGEGATLNASAMNGTYPFRVEAIAGWAAGRYTGTITVDGASPSAVAVTFVAVVYAVTFTVAGLPAGTPWSVTVLGTTHATDQASLELAVTNGSYPYSFAAVGGFALTNGTGTLLVHGSPTSAAAWYTANLTLPAYAPWLFVGLATAALAAVVLGWRRRRRRSPPAAGPAVAPELGSAAPDAR